MSFKGMIIDGHNDTMMHIINRESLLPEKDIGEGTDLHIDIEKLKKAGLSNPIFAAFTEGEYENIPKNLSKTLSILNGLYFTEEKNREEFKIVGSVDEIYQNYKEGRIGAIASIEGAYFIDKNNYIEILRQLHDLKIKLIGFNWNYSNYLGEGVAAVYSDKITESHGGLTPLGKKTIKEMEKLGMVVDVSHMNEETFYGVIKNSKNPVVASHSGAAALREHRRNLKDEQLLKLKENGGVVGVVLSQGFLTDGREAYLQDFFRHIDYIAALIGIDHIGIGSDFDGTKIPADLKDSSEFKKIIEGLRLRGYTEEEIDKISHKNFLRVFKAAEENSTKKEELDLEIETSLDMGVSLRKGDLFNMTVKEGYRKGLKYKYILDGILVEYGRLEGPSMNFRINLDNSEKFHIVTVKISDGHRLKRETKLVYLED